MYDRDNGPYASGSVTKTLNTNERNAKIVAELDKKLSAERDGKAFTAGGDRAREEDAFFAEVEAQRVAAAPVASRGMLDSFLENTPNSQLIDDLEQQFTS